MTIKILAPEKPGTPDEVLEHHGVKGMRWGVRREHRRQMRALNRASRRKDKFDRKRAHIRERNARDRQIDEARARISGGQARRDLREARRTFKTEKHVIGSREARKNRLKVRQRVMSDKEVAQQVKSGRETRNAVLLTVGSIAVTHVLKQRALKRAGR